MHANSTSHARTIANYAPVPRTGGAAPVPHRHTPLHSGAGPLGRTMKKAGKEHSP